MDKRNKFTPLFVLKIIGGVLAFLGFAVLIAFALGFFVMLLWNWLMPVIFGLGKIGYWQAFGLILLAKILFGHGFHGLHRPQGDKWGHHHGNDRDWTLRSGRHGWRYYSDYWSEEGKDAFEKYIERRESEKENRTEK
jgi:hypothetical protein